MIIYKYKISDSGKEVFSLHDDYEILTAKVQYGELVMWVKVDPLKPSKIVTIEVIGTGQTVPHNAKYVSTIEDGAYIWHIFDVTNSYQ